MANQKAATILDVTKGLGYQLVYQPVIGTKSSSQYPFIMHLPFVHRPFRRRFTSK